MRAILGILAALPSWRVLRHLVRRFGRDTGWPA